MREGDADKLAVVCDADRAAGPIVHHPDDVALGELGKVRRRAVGTRLHLVAIAGANGVGEWEQAAGLGRSSSARSSGGGNPAT